MSSSSSTIQSNRSTILDNNNRVDGTDTGETKPTISSPIDVSFTGSDGIQLAAQLWKLPKYHPTTTTSNSVLTTTTTTIVPTTTTTNHHHHHRRQRILCIHGWMDNCRSFHFLAPHVLQRLAAAADENDMDDIEIVAIDLPGHGWSSHKSLDGPPILITDYVYYIAELIRLLQWHDTTNTNTSNNNSNNRSNNTAATPPPPHDDAAVVTPTTTQYDITLIGHSMGAAISCLYAATFPEQIQQLILIEGAGPMTRPGNDFTKHLRTNIEQRQKQQSSPQFTKPPRIYPTLHQAILTRMAAVKKFPGQQYISEVTATELVVRGTKKAIGMNTDETYSTSNSDDLVVTTGYQFRHDPRLQLPSIQYCTDEQVDGMYRHLKCPVVMIMARDGWPISSAHEQMARIQPQIFVTLPGSHHLHADPDTANAVVETIVQNRLSTHRTTTEQS